MGKAKNTFLWFTKVVQNVIHWKEVNKVEELKLLVEKLIMESKSSAEKDDMKKQCFDVLETKKTYEKKINYLLDTAKNLLFYVNHGTGHSLLIDFYDKCKKMDGGTWVNNVITAERFGLTPDVLERIRFKEMKNRESGLSIPM